MTMITSQTAKLQVPMTFKLALQHALCKRVTAKKCMFCLLQAKRDPEPSAKTNGKLSCALTKHRHWHNQLHQRCSCLSSLCQEVQCNTCSCQFNLSTSWSSTTEATLQPGGSCLQSLHNSICGLPPDTHHMPDCLEGSVGLSSYTCCYWNVRNS